MPNLPKVVAQSVLGIRCPAPITKDVRFFVQLDTKLLPVCLHGCQRAVIETTTDRLACLGTLGKEGRSAHILDKLGGPESPHVARRELR